MRLHPREIKADDLAHLMILYNLRDARDDVLAPVCSGVARQSRRQLCGIDPPVATNVGPQSINCGQRV